MPQLSMLVPALGASSDGAGHNLWWIILALVVFALVTPVAFLAGLHGRGPRVQRPPRRG